MASDSLPGLSSGFRRSVRSQRESEDSLTCRENLFRLLAEDFLGFLHQSVFAKLSIILVRLANAILESLGFPVYVCEWVRVLLIFHDVPPLTRILLFGASVPTR